MDLVGNTGAEMNPGSSNNTCENNLWYGCGNVTAINFTHDYNAFGNNDAQFTDTNGQTNISSAIFTAYSTHDYTLSSGTEAGNTLGSPYNTDMNGNTRGDDGTFDRGAFEFDSEGDPPAGGDKSGKVVRIGDQTYD